MSELTGSEIIAKALRAQGTQHVFYLMGGPMLKTENSCMREGIVAIEMRHEQEKVDAGITAVVNVKTDPAARCTTQTFTLSMT